MSSITPALGPLDRLDPQIDLLRVSEVALLLRIPRNAVYELVRCERLRAVRIGRRLRVPRSALQSYLQRCDTLAAAKGGVGPSGRSARLADVGGA